MPKTIEFVSFPHLSQEDLIFCLNLRNEKRIREVSLSSDIISLEDHLTFVEHLRYCVDTLYFMVRLDGHPAGVLSLKAIDRIKGFWEYGWYFSLDVPGASKVARAFSTKVFALLGVHELHNHVRFDNELGMHLAIKEGFTIGKEDPLYPGFAQTTRKIESSEIDAFLQDPRFRKIDCRIVL